MIDPQTLALCEAETQETFLPAPDALAPADRDKLLSYLDRLGENEAAMKRQIAELGRALLIMNCTCNGFKGVLIYDCNKYSKASG